MLTTCAKNKYSFGEKIANYVSFTKKYPPPTIKRFAY